MVKKSTGKKILAGILLVIFIMFLGITVWNMDFVLSLLRAYRSGTLTVERIRFDIASFNLGQPIRVTPIATRVSAQDGMTQVFVPKGNFIMGTGDQFDGKDTPTHVVYLSAFWMDQVEVTNSMYAKCVQAGVCTLPAIDSKPYYGKWVYRDYPVVYVTWFQAVEYCQWTGRRLPTEAEWEKSARGTDGRTYPWGNELPNPRLANFSLGMRNEAVPVYRYPSGASRYGALNMAGNVREWVADWFAPDYYLHSPRRNPLGPPTGTQRSLRSGSYNEDQREIAVYHRFSHSPDSPGLSRGFRCAQDAK